MEYENDNKSEEVVEQEVVQPPQEETTTTDDQATETGVKDETTTTEKEESFLPEDEQAKLEADLTQHPEWRPFIDNMKKNLQGGFTRAMQKVPKELRDPATLKSIQDKAALYDKLDKDPRMVKLINDYTTNAKKDEKAESKGEVSDFVENFKKDSTPEEKAFLERFEPLFKYMIDKAVKPLADESNLTKEQIAQKDLNEKFSDKYDIDIMDADSWQTIKGYKEQNPNLSYEQCLKLAVLDIYPETFEKVGQEKAVSQIKKQTKQQVVIGSSKGGGSETGRYTDEQLEAMSPEEYARAMGLQRAPER